MPSAPVPQHRIATRSSNKSAHPGLVVKGKQRRTTAEVQQEREAKAQAKAAQEKTKRQNINRTAEFEHAEMANADIVDATPRPSFTPKPRPAPNNYRKAGLSPITESSDGEIFEGYDESFVSSCLEKSVAGDNLGYESEAPPPPAKKVKAVKTGKAVVTARAKIDVVKKVAEKRKKVNDDDNKIVPDSEEDKPQEPKPKKVKVKVRDEIDIVMKQIEEDRIRNRYDGNMAKSMPIKHAGEELRRPAPEAPSQVQAWVNKKLKREGAIADINALYDTRVNNAAAPDSESSR
jgi:hypothetical protein